jgi:hypothetical protein
MTRPAHPSVVREVVQALAEQGFDGMAQAMELLINECMKVERQQALGVGPYQRGEGRRGQANGFKPKRLKTRVGELALSVPQVRGAKFYPTALERGSRSEKALRLALAEMYVQGVSTSKVTKITEELCGCEISSSDVSRATALLDEDLQKWRSRPLDQVKYLILDARYEKVRHAGSVRDCAVLTAIGVDAEGRRSVLGALRSGSPLAGVLQEPLGPRPAWRRADHKRCACGLGGGAQGVLQRRALATLPVPPHAERSGSRAAGGDQARRDRRSGERLGLGRRAAGGRATRPRRAQVRDDRAEAGPLDGRERAGELRRVPLAGGASRATADDEHAGARSPGTEAPHARGVAVPQRRLAATIGDRRPDGNQRRMGDR